MWLFVKSKRFGILEFKGVGGWGVEVVADWRNYSYGNSVPSPPFLLSQVSKL